MTPDETLMLPDEALYAQIGEVLIPSAGALPDRVERAARAGRLWLDNHRLRLQGLLCPRVDALTNGTAADNVTLATAVADLIAGSIGTVPAFSVAALLVRKGLTEFCEE